MGRLDEKKFQIEQSNVYIINSVAIKTSQIQGLKLFNDFNSYKIELKQFSDFLKTCRHSLCVCPRVSHHAAADSSAAQGVVLSEAGSTQLEREEVGHRSLANQRVEERLQCLVRLERDE